MNARDAALLRRWSEHRDAEAFNDLVSHYADMVYATCKRTLGNPADAEDLTQECFLKLATSNVRIRTSLGGWLHSAATSLSINRLRSDTRRRKREEIAAADVPSTAEPTWDDIQRHVDEAIAELPENLRDPLIRHFLQRETHDQIAQDLGVTRSTVTKRVANGIERVREKLKKSGVLLTTAALTALASERMVEAAPAPLKAALGRLALSGAVPPAVAAATGMTLLTKALLGLVLVVTACVGATVAYHRFDAPPPVPSPERPVQVSQKALASGTKPAQQSAQPAHSTPAVVPAANGGANSGSVSGRVYDKETLKGIPGAELRVSSGERFIIMAQTNEQGEYRFDNLAASTWTTYCFSANGYYIDMEKPEQREKNVRKLKLEPGGSLTGIDFALGRGEGLRGVAVDTAGKPMAGALVTAATPISTSLFRNTAESREDGTFFVSGFPPTGVLYVWADKGTLVSPTGGPYALPQKNRPLDPLVLQQEATLRGVVQDKQGKPLAGLKVTPVLMPDEANRKYEVLSGADGRFELKGMPAGAAWVRVCNENSIMNQPCPTITLAAEQVMDDLVLTCTMGDLSISGQVVDSQGAALSWAGVDCTGGEPPQGQHVSTRADGKFRFEKLEAGTYKLMAWHKKHLRVDDVEVAAGNNNVRLVMPDGIPVEGRVVDADTGKPIPVYRIAYCDLPDEMFRDYRYEKIESPDGTFKLKVAQLGDIRIAARVEGCLLGYADVSVDASGPVLRDVIIRLKPQANLRGRVQDAKGAPIAGAGIFSGRLEQHGNNLFASALTESDGSFVLPAQKLSGDLIVVHHPNLGNGEVTLEPKHYAGEPIDVTIPSGTSLACTVLVNGAPFQGASLLVLPEQSRPVQTGLTGSDGKCLIGAMLPGEYRIQVNLPPAPQEYAETMQTRIASLVAGQTTELVVEFTQGDASISGTVDPSFKPEYILLTVVGTQGEQKYIRSFQKGRGDDSSFSFPNLPVGEATMEVRMTPTENETIERINRRYTFALTPGAAIRQDINLNEGAAFWGTMSPISSTERKSLSFYTGDHTLEEVDVIGIHKDFYASTPVAADGTFRIGGFEPGTYTVVATTRPLVNPQPGQERKTSIVVELGPQGQELNLQIP